MELQVNIKDSKKKDRFNVGKTYISITNLQNSLKIIENLVKDGENAQICVCDFGAVCFANTNDEYNEIINNSVLTNPDGIPLIWLSRIWGISNISQTMGPALFINMLNSQNGIKHFLLGDTDETLYEIEKKYSCENCANIVGSYSPPFLDISEFDYAGISKIINDSEADIVWVSMTSPKQDYFGKRILPYLNKKVIVGVGAAFRYSIGLYKLPDGLSRKIGLAGFMRKANFWNDLKWYLKHSFLLFKFTVGIITKRATGKKYYE